MSADRRRVNLRPLPPTPEQAGPSGYAGIGAALGDVRRRAELSVEQIADRLRIRRQYIEAIELGQFERLPGHIYAMGFLRTYAEHLGLDGDAVVEAFKQENADAVVGRLVFPIPKPEQRTPKGWLMVLAILMAVGIYAGWYYHESKRNLALDQVQPVPERLVVQNPAPPPIDSAAVATAAAPAATPAPIPAPAAPPAPVAAVPAPLPAPAPPVTATAPVPPAPLPTMGVEPPPPPVPPALNVARPAEPVIAAIPAPAPVPTPPPPVAAPVVAAAPPSLAPVSGPGIVVRALGESWIQVRATDNAVLESRQLKTGDTYRPPNRSDLVLMTGNAGGLEIVIDGRSTGPLGAPGAVRRNLTLDPEKLRSGTLNAD